MKCVKTSEECLQTSQCCSSNDVCLTFTRYSKYAGVLQADMLKSEVRLAAMLKNGGNAYCNPVERSKKYRTSTCQNVKELSRHIMPFKKAGSPCQDSLECLDLCCREVRGHRYGVYHVCGKPEDRYMSYRCTTNLGVRGENDVIDSYGGYNKIDPWA